MNTLYIIIIVTNFFIATGCILCDSERLIKNTTHLRMCIHDITYKYLRLSKVCIIMGKNNRRDVLSKYYQVNYIILTIIISTLT